MPWIKPLASAHCVALLLLTPASASADVTHFNSFRGFANAAPGAQRQLVTFDEFTADTSFAQTPLDVGPFSWRVDSDFPTGPPSQDTASLIDVSPFFDEPTGNGTTVNGTPHVRAVVNNDLFDRGDTTLTAAFDQPITAWAADFNGAATRELLDIVLTPRTADLPIVIPVDINTGFFGFALAPGLSVQEVTFRARLTLDGNEQFSIDNVRFVAVPEPTTLLPIGLAALALRQRR